MSLKPALKREKERINVDAVHISQALILDVTLQDFRPLFAPSFHTLIRDCMRRAEQWKIRGEEAKAKSKESREKEKEGEIEGDDDGDEEGDEEDDEEDDEEGDDEEGDDGEEGGEAETEKLSKKFDDTLSGF